MSANSSIILSSLDFDTIKNTFKTYLKTQDRFKDYDFDGSNMSVLLDVLSYNTFHNAFYLNMVGSEMFLDSAQLRDSVVSHAKELNYVPRSFKSSQANVTITVNSSVIDKRSLVVPKGYTFTSRFGASSFTFSTAENIIISDYTINSNRTQLTFTGTNIPIYEGYYVADTYTYSSMSPQRFIISNKNVDTSSITVTVSEDMGSTILSYNRAQSLFDINSSSPVFFVQGAENDSYEIIFGDGINGRMPKNNSVITIEYRISNGELPNGCRVFTPDAAIDDETNITVTTNEPSTGGAISETLESIKYNAPRHFNTQERAITTEDYETLLRINFPEVNAVTAYGGENLDPPQFGKVFVAVDLNEVDSLPQVKIDQYYNFLKPRSPVSIDPVFVDPEYTYIQVKSIVNYNVNVTRLSTEDIKTITKSAIMDYAQLYLNNFNRIFRYSKMIQAIDNSQSSIISNETNINIIKVLTPETGTLLTFDVNFRIPLGIVYGSDGFGYSISSTVFNYKGNKAVLKDDGISSIQVYSASTGQFIETVGVIDYDSGLLQFSNFKIDSYVGAGIKIYAAPKNKDISTINNVILNIIEEDVEISAVAVRA
jgi:hypothetical protein